MGYLTPADSDAGDHQHQQQQQQHEGGKKAKYMLSAKATDEINTN